MIDKRYLLIAFKADRECNWTDEEVLVLISVCIVMALNVDRGYNWMDEGVLVIISVWSDDVIQTELKGFHQNQHIFQKMADELKKQGYERSWEKCREKVKKTEEAIQGSC